MPRRVTAAVPVLHGCRCRRTLLLTLGPSTSTLRLLPVGVSATAEPRSIHHERKILQTYRNDGALSSAMKPSQHKTSTSPSLGPLQKKSWVRAQFFITKRAYFYTLQLLANEIVLASVIDIIRRMPVFKNEQSFPLSLKPHTTLKCCISEQKAKFYTSEVFFCIFHYSSDWKSILFYNNYDEQKLGNILIDFCSPQHCNISCCHSSGIWIPCVKRLQEEAQVAFS